MVDSMAKWFVKVHVVPRDVQMAKFFIHKNSTRIWLLTSKRFKYFINPRQSGNRLFMNRGIGCLLIIF